jgi:hypothetical protein
VRDIFIDDLREEFTRDYVFPMFRRARCPLSCLPRLVPALSCSHISDRCWVGHNPGAITSSPCCGARAAPFAAPYA